MADIYLINNDELIPEAKLPQKVRTKLNKIKNKKAQRISQISWTVLFLILKDKYSYNLCNDDLEFNKNGKPYFKNKKICFNISHSDNLIAIGVSKKPIGIDVQRLIDINKCSLIAKNILNEKEYNRYLKTKNKRDYLTKKWTIKEAFIKHKGLSIINIRDIKSKSYDGIFTYQVKDNKNNKYYLSIKGNYGAKEK